MAEIGKRPDDLAIRYAAAGTLFNHACELGSKHVNTHDPLARFDNTSRMLIYGLNRAGVEADTSLIQNWWRQGMMGSAKAHHNDIKAFSETDFTEDLKVIEAPTLVMHGDDDQVVPIGDSAPLTAKLLK